MAAISGTAFWAKVHEPVESKFEAGKFEYSINVGKLDAGTIETLNSLGLGHKIKVDPKGDMGTYVQFKAKDTKNIYNKETGESELVENAIAVVDGNRDDISPEVLIGNGSQVVVSIRPYKHMGKTHAELLGVMVTDLREYVRSVNPMDDFANYSLESSDSAFAA